MANSNKRCIRILLEIENFQHDPPPGIKIAVDKSNTDVIHALIFGVRDTPYQGGFFYLVVTFAPIHPFLPPKIQFMTTGGSNVRFNPNFWECGKICIDLLENAWSPACTLVQTLVSLQSLLNERPYHNETGYKKEKVPGDVDKYNEIIKHETLRVAVVGMLDNDFGIVMPECLQLAMKEYYLNNCSFYQNQALSQLHLDGKNMQDPFGINSGVFDFKTILNRLEKINLRLMTPSLIVVTDSTSNSSTSSAPKSKSSMSSSTISNSNMTSSSTSTSSTSSSISSSFTPTPFISNKKSKAQSTSLQDVLETALTKTRVQHNIMKEIMMFESDPPPGIVIASDEVNCTTIHALIFGPTNTPYEGGFFYFVLDFPTSFLRTPPKVTFMTTGGGTVTFNPNLYPSGKVCLSILETWSERTWAPAMTISSLLISIQSLLTENPYHNQSGFEKEKTPGGVDKYNQVIKHETLRVAVVGMLDNNCGLTIPHRLQSVMKENFLQRFLLYKSQAQSNLHLDRKKMQDPFGDNRGNFQYKSILQRLEKINARLTSSPKPDGPPTKKLKTK